MQELFLLGVFGYCVQVLEDYKKQRLAKHPFFLTRQTYVAMLVTIGIDFFNLDNSGWLATFAPLSIAVCFSYLVLGRDYEELHSSSSVFGHAVMPYIALYSLLQTTYPRYDQRANWYPLAIMLLFFALHYGGQWMYFFWKSKTNRSNDPDAKKVYPEIDLHTLQGNLKVLITPGIATAISIAYIYIDLSNIWIFYGASIAMFGTWLVRAFFAARNANRLENQQNQQDEDEYEDETGNPEEGDVSKTYSKYTPVYDGL